MSDLVEANIVYQWAKERYFKNKNVWKRDEYNEVYHKAKDIFEEECMEFLEENAK